MVWVTMCLNEYKCFGDWPYPNQPAQAWEIVSLRTDNGQPQTDQPRSVQCCNHSHCGYQTDPKKNANYSISWSKSWFGNGRKSPELVDVKDCRETAFIVVHLQTRGGILHENLKEATAISLFSSKMKSPSPVCSNMQSFSSLPKKYSQWVWWTIFWDVPKVVF